MDNPLDPKEMIRVAAADARRQQKDRNTVSAAIAARVMALPEYRRAGSVLWYVGVRSEVATLDVLPRALAEDRQIALPYCVGDELELFRLSSLEQLLPGAYGILEPSSAFRSQSQHRVSATDLDLVVVPGVAFDVCGGRLGHGRGYYDRLLAQVRDQTVLVGAAFECQIVAAVPMEDHDVRMDFVVTQSRTIECRRQGGLHVGAEPC